MYEYDDDGNLLIESRDYDETALTTTFITTVPAVSDLKR